MIAQILLWLGFQRQIKICWLIFLWNKNILIFKILWNINNLFAWKTIKYLATFKAKILINTYKKSIYFKRIINIRQFSIDSLTKLTILTSCTIMKIMNHLRLEYVVIQQMIGTKRHIHKLNNFTNLIQLINLKKECNMQNKIKLLHTKRLKLQKGRVDLQLSWDTRMGFRL